MWVLLIQNHIPLDAAGHDRGDQQDGGAAFLKPSVAVGLSGFISARVPTWHPGAVDFLNCDLRRYDYFNPGIISGEPADVGVYQDFKKSPSE